MDIVTVPFEFKHMLVERATGHFKELKAANEAQIERFVERIFCAEIVIAVYPDRSLPDRFGLYLLKGRETYLREIQGAGEGLREPFPVGLFEVIPYMNRADAVKGGRPATH